MAIIVNARAPKRRKGLMPIKRLHEQKAPTPEEEVEADQGATEFIERMLADGREAHAWSQRQRPPEPLDEITAETIRGVFNEDGEFAAAIELRRHFPGILNNQKAAACARTIASWTPLPPRKLPKCRTKSSTRVGAEPAQGCRPKYPLAAWVVMKDQSDYPGELLASSRYQFADRICARGRQPRRVAGANSARA